jgi:hypothetical protein
LDLVRRRFTRCWTYDWVTPPATMATRFDAELQSRPRASDHSAWAGAA